MVRWKLRTQLGENSNKQILAKKVEKLSDFVKFEQLIESNAKKSGDVIFGSSSDHLWITFGSAMDHFRIIFVSFLSIPIKKICGTLSRHHVILNHRQLRSKARRWKQM